MNNGESLADGIVRIKKEFPKSEWNKEICNLRNNFNMNKIRTTGLEYLEGEDKEGYLHDMRLTEKYADANRVMIMEKIMEALGIDGIKDSIKTTHNYIGSDNIIRKGAIRSYVGERMIIPFNPVAGILICEGKSNPEWNFSAPHGAGRIMSRSEAKKTITNEMARESMGDVFSTCVPVDENPLVYKDPVLIEKCIEPTAKILDRIKPIHSMKNDDVDFYKKKKK